MKMIIGTVAILVGLFMIILGTFQFLPKGWITENRCKKYIIEHKDELRWSNNEQARECWKLDSCDLNYFTDVTIRLLDDDTFSIIFWGDRKSWMWDFRLDKDFTIDTRYNKLVKNKDIKIDNEIIKILLENLKNRKK